MTWCMCQQAFAFTPDADPQACDLTLLWTRVRARARAHTSHARQFASTEEVQDRLQPIGDNEERSYQENRPVKAAPKAGNILLARGCSEAFRMAAFSLSSKPSSVSSWLMLM